jgi:hypothetical protein
MGLTFCHKKKLCVHLMSTKCPPLYFLFFLSIVHSVHSVHSKIKYQYININIASEKVLQKYYRFVLAIKTILDTVDTMAIPLKMRKLPMDRHHGQRGFTMDKTTIWT